MSAFRRYEKRTFAKNELKYKVFNILLMLHTSVQKLSQRKRSIIVHIPPRNDNILSDPFQQETSEIISHKIQLISDNI